MIEQPKDPLLWVLVVLHWKCLLAVSPASSATRWKSLWFSVSCTQIALKRRAFPFMSTAEHMMTARYRLVQIFKGLFARNRLDEDTRANCGSGVGNTQKA